MTGIPLASVAPKARKHLSADALFRLGHTGLDHIPDYRPAAVDMALSEVRLSACARFSLKAPSLLAFDKERAEGHVHTIYGMTRVPCDTPMRESLAPVSPKLLRPMCTSLLRQLQRGKGLAAMTCLEGHSVVALDGTGAVSSKTIHCASCLHQVHRHGSLPSTHPMWGTAILHPDGRAVSPLRPAPIVQHDGTGQNAGERHAAKRCVAHLRHAHPHRRGMVTEDSWSAHAPHIETLHAYGLRSILGGTAGDHTVLFQHVQAAEPAGHVTSYARHDRATQGVHRLRCVHDVPLNASNPNVRVNLIEDGERGQAKVQPCRWGTDRRVSKRNVSHLMRGGTSPVEDRKRALQDAEKPRRSL
jgi:hypothetical protein